MSTEDQEKLLTSVQSRHNINPADNNHNIDWPEDVDHDPIIKTIKTKRNLEICVLVLVVGVVLGLFSIPIIYHVTKDVKAKPIEIPTNVTINCSNISYASSYLLTGDDDFEFSMISCGKGFYKLNDSCRPECNKFNQDQHALAIMMDVIIQWFGWFGIITIALVLLVSVIKYKSMFTFPTVFVVYMSISYCTVVAFVLATTINTSRSLYCNHRDLLESMRDPTIFCRISGIAFQYCIVNATLFWFCHVSVIFYKLMFPFKAKKTEKYEKYVHVLFVAICLILPLPAILYTELERDHQYIPVLFPPLMCLPNDSRIFYYSTILVLNVLTAFGVSMFIPMFWVVHKHQGIFKRRVGGIALTAAEMKLLFTLFFFVLFGVSTILYFQRAIDDQNEVVNGFEKYFECVYCFGNDTLCDKHQTDFQRYTHTPERAASYIVMSFLPMALLIFVVNWNKVCGCFTSFGRICFRRKARTGTKSHLEGAISSHSALSPIPETSICITKST